MYNHKIYTTMLVSSIAATITPFLHLKFGSAIISPTLDVIIVSSLAACAYWIFDSLQLFGEIRYFFTRTNHKENPHASREVHQAHTINTEIKSNSISADQQSIDEKLDHKKELVLKRANISEAMGNINDISYQINLLSLNAAIEAARQGENGKNFATVAHELRAFSQRTIHSIDEIRNIISSIETVDEQSSTQAEFNKQATQDDLKTLSLAKTTLHNIALRSNEANALFKDISLTTKEQENITLQLKSDLEIITLLAEAAEETSNITAIKIIQIATKNFQREITEFAEKFNFSLKNQ